MLPVLKVTAAGEVGIRDCIDRLAGACRLSEAERGELLPSGKQTIIANRAHWARTYLVQAGLLDATRRGHFKITDRGKAVLARAPERIDNKLLLEFPEFQAFKRRRKPNGVAVGGDPVETAPDTGHVPVISRATPEEVIDGAYQEITDELRSTLLNRITAASPAFFE